MPSVFFYTICIAFASGVFARSFFVLDHEIIALLLVVSVAGALVWRLRSAQFRSPLFFLSLVTLVFAVGVYRMDEVQNSPSILVPYVGEMVSVTGKVVREPEWSGSTLRLHVAPFVHESASRERVLVRVDRFAFEEDKVRYGDIVRVQGELALPEPFETDTGRVFDYPGYLQAQKVYTVIPEAEIVEVIEGGYSLLRSLYDRKHSFMDSIEDALSQPYAALGEGLLLGVKQALPDTLDEAFRKTGIIHIVVLSGYNLLIVAEVMMYVLSFLLRPRERMLIGISGIITFACLVGLSATVVRASIMACLLLIARGTGRTYAVLRALSLAAVVMLLINPSLLVHDPGFQLSFLATFGLIIFAPIVERGLVFLPATWGIRSIATATIATQIIVLPLLLYQTGMLSIVAVVVNMLVLPIVPFAMMLTFLVGVTGLVSAFLGKVVGYVAYVALGYIIEMAIWFAELPLSTIIIDAFPFWVVACAYAILALGYLGVRTREKDDQVWCM